MELVDFIHPVLTNVEYGRLSVKVTFLACTFLFFSLTFVTSAIVSSATKTFSGLRQKEKVFWNLAISRAVFGIFATIFSLWSYFYGNELENDIIFAKTPTSYFTMIVTNGFFIFECTALTVSDFLYKRGSILLNIHHWLSLAGYTSALFSESSHFLGTRGLILEMSTPFSAVCWLLLKAKKSDTIAWKVNQFILVHTFHLRSVVEFYLWYETYMHWSEIWTAMPFGVFIIFYTALFLSTVVMTPYWTMKKTQQMITPVDWNFVDSNKNPNNNENGTSKLLSSKRQ